MSNFKKRLVETRMNRVAEGEEPVKDDKTLFLEALSAAGIEFPGGNEKVLDDHQWQKIGVLDIIAGPLANEFMAVSAGQPQVDYLVQKIQEFDSKLEEWSNTYYNKLGETTINRLKFALSKCKDSIKGLNTIVNFSQAGSGNKKLSELEDEQLEKMASIIMSEVEDKLRALFSSLK